MSAETIERLTQSPYRSFWRERLLATELYEWPRESRELEHNLALLSLYLTYGENPYDVGSRGSRPLEHGWLPATMYRGEAEEEKKRYTHNHFSPEGQCFPSLLALALFAERSEFKKSGQIKEIHVKDGELYEEVQGGKMALVSDHHGWVQIDAHDGRRWILDLAAHQFAVNIDNPDGHIRVVMQGLDGHVTDPNIPGVNWRMFRNNMDIPAVVPNAHPLHYVENSDRSMPLRELDWKKASGGRAELLLGAVGLRGRLMLGHDRRSIISLPNKWSPKGFDHRKARRGEALQTYPVAMPESSGMSIHEAAAFVERSSRGLEDLSIEGLGLLLKELMDECPVDTLVEWAVDRMNSVVNTLMYWDRKNSIPGQCVSQSQQCLREGTDIPDNLIAKLTQLSYRIDANGYPDTTRRLTATNAILNAMMAVRILNTNIDDPARLRNSVKIAIFEGSEVVDSRDRELMRCGRPSVYFRNRHTDQSERHWQYLDLYRRMHPRETKRIVDAT